MRGTADLMCPCATALKNLVILIDLTSAVSFSCKLYPLVKWESIPVNFMKTKILLKNVCAICLIISISALSMPMPVKAAMVGNSELVSQFELQTQRDEVRTFMAREDVRSALLGYGVSNSEIDTRINNMTSSELLQVQDKMAQLPAGSGVLGVVLGVILILILLDLLGATDIFPRI